MSSVNLSDVHIAVVNVGSRRRALNRAKVKQIADSMREIGLLNPITVCTAGTEYTLIAGRHRIEAARSLDWRTIPALVVDLADTDRHIAEIDENLMRNELTDLERAEHLAARKGWYEAKHPETKRGGDRGNQHTGGKPRQTETISFSQDTSTKTGRTERAIRQDVQIAESIPDDVRDAIRETPLADSKIDLLNLARLPEDQQREVIAEADLSDKGSFRSEIERRKPSPKRTPDPEIGDTYVEDLNQDPGDDIPLDADPDAAAEMSEPVNVGQDAPIPDQPAAATDSGRHPESSNPAPPAAPEPGMGSDAWVHQQRSKAAAHKPIIPERSAEAPAYRPPTVDGKAPVYVYPGAEGLMNAVESHLGGDDFDEFDRLYQEHRRQVLARRRLAGQDVPSETPARTPSEIDGEIATLPIGQQRGLISRIAERLDAEDLERFEQSFAARRAELLKRAELAGVR